jgi:P27 family predicted phage terminase small subunit
MSERACTAWKVLAAETVALNVLTTADLPALALLCETQATAAELEETIKLEGFTIPTGNDGKKAHPALKSLESTRNCAARLLAEFGLTPKSRKYVEKAPASRDEDECVFRSNPR